MKTEVLSPDQPVAQFEIGSMQNFVYLIVDWRTRGAWVVDPQQDLSPWASQAQDLKLKLEGILLTHTHFDHIGGVLPIHSRHPELPIWVHSKDAFRLEKLLAAHPSMRTVIKYLDNVQTLKLGGLEAEVLHTPGHSAGGCCFLVRSQTSDFLLTGDTLFIGDCGRTDLETGSVAQMFDSLCRIRALAAATLILPGHHYSAPHYSTIEIELRQNRALQARSIEELEALP